MESDLYYKIKTTNNQKILYSNQNFSKFWTANCMNKCSLYSCYTGLPLKETFFNYNPDTENVDVIIAGVPYSKGSLIKSEVDKFPNFLRLFSLDYSVYEQIDTKKSSGIFFADKNISLFKDLKFRDIGDILTNNIKKEIDEMISWLYNKKMNNISIGGDHSITYHCINSISDKYNRPIIPIIFDAHHDCRSTLYKDEELNHSNFVSKLIELDNVYKIIQVGVRGVRSISHVASSKKIISLNFSNSQLVECINEIIKERSDALGYISVDLDVLSPMEFSAVDFPIPGQPVASKLLDSIYEIFNTKLKIISADMVEGVTNGECYQYRIPLQILCYLLDGFNTQININKYRG